MAILEESIKEVKALKNYIDGEWVESQSEPKDVVNSATSKIIAKVPISTKDELQEAIEAAKEAYPDWRRTTPLASVRCLFRLKELMEENLKS
ncbi:MAG: Methylmalonate-semialdehyde dehydrogenase [Parcubacteria bacterium 32_520]|nr:MAG: Methylmalonate-semialdehyde dehydrogenase [Parcubacteria bacterium 32_520]